MDVSLSQKLSEVFSTDLKVTVLKLVSNPLALSMVKFGRVNSDYMAMSVNVFDGSPNPHKLIDAKEG